MEVVPSNLSKDLVPNVEDQESEEETSQRIHEMVAKIAKYVKDTPGFRSWGFVGGWWCVSGVFCDGSVKHGWFFVWGGGGNGGTEASKAILRVGFPLHKLHTAYIGEASSIVDVVGTWNVWWLVFIYYVYIYISIYLFICLLFVYSGSPIKSLS